MSWEIEFKVLALFSIHFESASSSLSYHSQFHTTAYTKIALSTLEWSSICRNGTIALLQYSLSQINIVYSKLGL